MIDYHQATSQWTDKILGDFFDIFKLLINCRNRGIRIWYFILIGCMLRHFILIEVEVRSQIHVDLVGSEMRIGKYKILNIYCMPPNWMLWEQISLWLRNDFQVIYQIGAPTDGRWTT